MSDKQIEIYQSEDGAIELNVQLENETVWLSQAQMVELFGRERSVIAKYINLVSSRAQHIQFSVSNLKKDLSFALLVLKEYHKKISNYHIQSVKYKNVVSFFIPSAQRIKNEVDDNRSYCCGATVFCKNQYNQYQSLKGSL